MKVGDFVRPKVDPGSESFRVVAVDSEYGVGVMLTVQATSCPHGLRHVWADYCEAVNRVSMGQAKKY